VRLEVSAFVRDYNERRLHSAISYVTPLDKLLGRAHEIFAARDPARQRRAAHRQAAKIAV
jgi:hypothetical protein